MAFSVFINGHKNHTCFSKNETIYIKKKNTSQNFTDGILSKFLRKYFLSSENYNSSKWITLSGCSQFNDCQISELFSLNSEHIVLDFLLVLIR